MYWTVLGGLSLSLHLLQPGLKYPLGKLSFVFSNRFTNTYPRLLEKKMAWIYEAVRFLCTTALRFRQFGWFGALGR